MTKNGKRAKDSIFFTDILTEESSALERDFFKALEYLQVKDRTTVKERDIYLAISTAMRHRLIKDWLRTQHQYRVTKAKRVYYLSMEFLMGRLLGNMLMNIDCYNEASDLVQKLGYHLEELRDLEPDMGLGNGGLGRLAACFLESMATLELPAYGYGIRYEYGIFKQGIKNGYQVEVPDNWLKYGCPWEICRPELEYRVKFGGRVITVTDEKGAEKYKWVDTEDVIALAYDVPVPGYDTFTVNNLRLWQARSTNEFDFQYFNSGDYMAAVNDKNVSENISKVLYPNDNMHEGKVLRLKQQYFFVSATLQDIIKHYKKNHGNSFDDFPEKVCIQLNDTHPSIAIPELMRIFIDEEGIEWNDSWELTKRTFAYTNHTVLPEAVEKWDVDIMGPLLPRQLQIIYEINRRFINEARDFKGFDTRRIKDVSIFEEAGHKFVRMANLAIVGSSSVNGVSALHTEILKNDMFRDFNELFPGKINNKTNGITPRRWLKKANPFLANLISDQIGTEWAKNLDELKKLEPLATDTSFQEVWQEAKWLAKKQLQDYVKREMNFDLNVESMFDVQVKRMHEYKRQLLNVLHAITLYNRIKKNPKGDFVPRTKIFGGKAAPGYYVSKQIIKLINSVSNVVNNDPEVNKYLNVFFFPNYSVSMAEKIIPASELSEQISTAGFEASGTGNMKFMLNGALTIGTLDGANVEMLEEAGADNIFIFGLTADGVKEAKMTGYNPRVIYETDPELKEVLDKIRSNYFNPEEPEVFAHLFNDLVTYGDNYMLLADYRSYVNAQDKVEAVYRDRFEWTKKSILNTARSGKFSSDRTISEYADEIWHVAPVKVQTD
ncbi:MAG TPA: glycogen/starch/alpha-glucan phosphorylase [bacterium]|jgi:starch phosphorylase|nr:glycogen/starch/alpha-glucan phosphorylase [bacterium]